ncbi:hypothetical protein E4U55_002235 [Claviceps digitariae]|nr:hypothetical protein E4U55_002235 [Claviceps digitariae]
MIWSSLLPLLAYSSTAHASPASVSRRQAAAAAPANAANIAIDSGTQYQELDGFGVSQAFQSAWTVFGGSGLSPKNQSYVLDLLFSLEKGAGFSLLRNGIGTSDNNQYSRMTSIEPVSPGSPDATPKYVWDRNDTGQFPLAQEAYKRGLTGLYGSAWSAPGYMKTSGDDIGGSLCGVTNAPCPSGNWIKAYVNFLLKWVSFYQDAGVKVTQLGFLNEPELKTTYVSMLSNGTQASDVIRVLGPAIKDAGLDLKLTCCDAVGWQHQKEKMDSLQAGPDPAEAHLDIITAHGYASHPNFLLNTTRKVWQTEWSDLAPVWTPYTFYDKAEFGEGLTWAANIQTAFTHANVSGFFYWIGAGGDKANTHLITLLGDSVIPSKRYWAHASFSKFARPGARRIDATSSLDYVTVSSFLNTDGTVATQIINNGTDSVNLNVVLKGAASKASTVVPYLTDNDHDLTALPAIAVSGGSFTALVPARSLVSFVSSTATTNTAGQTGQLPGNNGAADTGAAGTGGEEKKKKKKCKSSCKKQKKQAE